MAAIPFMPLYVADYMSDAAHLSTIEHGAYLLLIMTYWQRGEPLPDDDKKLSRICRLTPRQFSNYKTTLSEFFDVTGKQWRHLRIDRELQKVHANSLKKRRGGLARAKQMHSTCSAPAQLSDTDTDTYTELVTNVTCESDDSPKLMPIHLKEEWNNRVAACTGLPAIRDLTPARQQLCKTRIKQYPLADFQAVFDNIQRSPFLRGDKGWKGATFDWALKRENYQKILEGNYND